MNKPFAESCERNQQAIFECIAAYLQNSSKRLLELGSGTGQHAVYMAPRLPAIEWQTSELAAYIAGIEAWLHDSPAVNLPKPLVLDVDAANEALLAAPYDVIFTANTLHYVPLSTAENFLNVAQNCAAPESLFFIYGPFNDRGRYTSEGNVRLDMWLKEREPLSGIKDIQWLDSALSERGFRALAKHSMPANNLIAVYQYDAAPASQHAGGLN